MDTPTITKYCVTHGGVHETAGIPDSMRQDADGVFRCTAVAPYFALVRDMGECEWVMGTLVPLVPCDRQDCHLGDQIGMVSCAEAGCSGRCGMDAHQERIAPCPACWGGWQPKDGKINEWPGDWRRVLVIPLGVD